MSTSLNKLAQQLALAMLGISLILPSSSALATNSEIEAKAPHSDDQSLRSILRQASKARVYITPSSSELKQVAQLFSVLLQAPYNFARLQKQAQALQMELRQIDGMTLLMEQAEAQRGRGLYAFRNGKAAHILQVPHAFTDEMTREIGLALFAEGRFAAVAFNTVPRRFKDANNLEVLADMTHINDSYFLEFAKAAAQALPNSKSLQIHGFDQSKRKTNSLAATDIILSAGHKQPPPSLQQGHKKLQQTMQTGVTLYANEVKELGATTNLQAQALRAIGYQNFIHVELSRPMREALRSDAKQRQRLLTSLLDGV